MRRLYVLSLIVGHISNSYGFRLYIADSEHLIEDVSAQMDISDFHKGFWNT